jgi:hypothetical protein
MTPAQRRNQMACRKLAQQRVLRIMQLQSTAPATKNTFRAMAGTKPSFEDSHISVV